MLGNAADGRMRLAQRVSVFQHLLVDGAQECARAETFGIEQMGSLR
jgi:hypothetical protein